MTEISALKNPKDSLETTLLGGRVRLIQPQMGYRIGMDGVLLASACASRITTTKSVKRVLELGCGVGGALNTLLTLCQEIHANGLERDTDYLGLAQENLALNGFEKRATLLSADIGAGFKGLGLDRFDLVFSNPPFFDDPEALRAPHLAKRSAWIADDGLEAWLEFAVSAVRDGGEIVFIHRADRLGDLLAGLSAKCGSFMIRPIAPFAGAPAKRILVCAKRLGKAPLQLLAPLILHDHGERKHTPEVEDMLYGRTLLEWR